MLSFVPALAGGCAPADDANGTDGSGGDSTGSGGGSLASGGSTGSGGGNLASSGGSAGSGGGSLASGGSTGSGGGSLGSGGAGSGGAETVPATFETVYFIIDAVPCNASDCHGHEMNGLHLVGTEDDMYDALLNTVSEPCENLPIVDPGNPQGSALVRLLNGPCGKLPQMPAGCSPEQGNCLSEKYLKAVEDWITAGAPR